MNTNTCTRVLHSLASQNGNILNHPRNFWKSWLRLTQDGQWQEGVKNPIILADQACYFFFFFSPRRQSLCLLWKSIVCAGIIIMWICGWDVKSKLYHFSLMALKFPHESNQQMLILTVLFQHQVLSYFHTFAPLNTCQLPQEFAQISIKSNWRTEGKINLLFTSIALKSCHRCIKDAINMYKQPRWLVSTARKGGMETTLHSNMKWNKWEQFMFIYYCFSSHIAVWSALAQ